MSKHVRSRDPRKPKIVAAIKRFTGASKVTMVQEMEDGEFRGQALTKAPASNRYHNLGYFYAVETVEGSESYAVMYESEYQRSKN